jgi:CRISPR-associated protein Cas2
MNDYMQYLICYDTPDNKRRRRIVQALEELTERVQWSVFEGWMNASQIRDLSRRLKRVIDPAADNLRIYRLCHYCREEVELLGVSRPTELVKYWIF